MNKTSSTGNNLLNYVAALPEGSKIYDHPASCLAVFRAFDGLTQQIVLRLILMKSPVLKEVVLSWMHADDVKSIDAIEASLRSARVVTVQQSSAVHRTLWAVNESFKQKLFEVLFLYENVALTPVGDASENEIAAVKTHMNKQWEATLQLLLDSDVEKGSARETVQILQNANLISRNGETTSITGVGFNFLLSDRQSQLWTLMKSTLDILTARTDVSECLNFLFQLHFSSPEKVYAYNVASPRATLVQIFHEFGLLRAFPYGRTRRLIVSPLMKQMFLSSAANEEPSDEPGYIVCENNYRVYAYTNCDLKVKLLQLFCHVSYRLPNMCCCLMTRDSVKEAIDRGITADSIIHFLTANVHEQSKVTRKSQGRPAFPPVLRDQIKLWEMEKSRVKLTPGFIYTGFDNKGGFDILSEYAKKIGCLLFCDSKRLIMVISESGHDDVRKFWKQNRHRTV